MKPLGDSSQRLDRNSHLLEARPEGLHLRDTILWLDSLQNADLCFVSSAANGYPKKTGQVLATEETVRLIETTLTKKPLALVCQYNRPFFIGKLGMELLPSGGLLGAASLYLELNGQKILYAPDLHPLSSINSRKMQLKKAQILVLGAKNPLPTNNTNLTKKKEKERFLSTVSRLIEKEIYPSIFCRPLGLAQEVCTWLSSMDHTVACHDSIYRYNKVFENYGCSLGKFKPISERSSKHRIRLYPVYPSQSNRRLRTKKGRDASLILEEGLHYSESLQLFDPIDDRFQMYTHLDIKDYKEIIQAVEPKEIYFFGPYSKKYSEEFSQHFPQSMALFPFDQPTLF